MFHYILKRVLIFLPTLLVITLITFILSINSPGDPVASLLSDKRSGEKSAVNPTNREAYIDLRKKLGLDQPVFYFTITSAALPDTLYRVPRQAHREMLERFAHCYGDWEHVAHYFEKTRAFERDLYRLEASDASRKTVDRARQAVREIMTSRDPKVAKEKFSELNERIDENSPLQKLSSGFHEAREAFLEMHGERSVWSRYVPAIHWHGIPNQYHTWLFGDRPWFQKADPGRYYRSAGVLRGDLGISYFNKRPVSSIVWGAMKWTFSLSALSILITYLIAVPIGVQSAVHKGSRGERIASSTLFMLFSLPNFWVGTLLITFLCNPDMLNIFPPAVSLMRVPDDAPFYQELAELAYHSALPLFCWTYASLAYLSRQMRGGLLNTMDQDYIRTARAKGLSEPRVVWGHAFRNSLIPVITLFGSIFPLLVSGSIAIEMIFSIPGMGKVTLDALQQNDYPVIYTVLMFTAVLTLVGMLVADVLYAVVDPRISFNKDRK